MKTRFNLTKLSLNLIVILTMAFSLASLTSCEKANDTLDLSADDTQVTAIDETLASELFDEIVEIGEEAEETSTTKSTEEVTSPFYRLSDCVTITREFNEDSRTITIDFGEENCEGPDGRLRRGKIIIVRSGFYWTTEVTATYSFENYFVDDNQLTGTKTYLGAFNDDATQNEDGSFNKDRTYSSSFITNGEIILADSAGTITWNAERYRTITEGAETWGFADNRVEVTGSSNGVTSDGQTFTSEITEPLVRIYQEDCFRFYVSGIVKIVKADGTEIIIDYGDGTCDDLATVTTNGESEIIQLGNGPLVN